MKLEFSEDSRNLHCQTRSRDSTSEVARDRKVRALRESSAVRILYRNLCLIIRMHALIEGHWRAIRVIFCSMPVKMEDALCQLCLKGLWLIKQGVVEIP